MLDPDPYPDPHLTNADPKHWVLVLFMPNRPYGTGIKCTGALKKFVSTKRKFIIFGYI
jgi:hypothetical protein